MFGFKMKPDLANRIQPPVFGPKRVLVHGQSGSNNLNLVSIWRCVSDNGATQAIIVPHANCKYMYEHLKLISSATTFGRHALVIMDGAGWHQQDLTDDFDNLTLLKLPPYSPELNPIEQVWQWLFLASL